MPAANHAGFDALKHDRLSVEHVGAIVADARIRAGDADGGLDVEQVSAVRGGVGDGGVTAERQKRLERVARAVAADEKSLVAVLVLDGLHLLGDVVKSPRPS